MKGVRFSRHARAIAAVLSLFALLQTASAQTAYQPPPHVNDPLEPMNRVIYNFNKNFFDRYILVPLIKFHNRAIPRPARVSIRHFFQNLKEPVTAENDLLQGRLGRAGQSVGRFGINTTVGVAGFMDVAEDMGLKRHEEDFGETMGHYGVGQGPYLVLPVLGSSSARDLSGRVVDEFLNPLHYVSYPNKTYIDIGLSGGELVSSRAHKVKAKMRAGEAVNPGYETDRERYLERKREEIENDIDTDDDEGSSVKSEEQMAQLAAPTSVISAPSNQMDAASSIRDQLAAMRLAPASLSINGTTLSVELPPNVSATPISCSDIWAKMNLDKLAGIEKIDVSIPTGSSQFSCTKFINPTTAPSLPPPIPGPPAEGPPKGLPGA